MKLKEKAARTWGRLKGGVRAVRRISARFSRPIAAFATAHAFPLQILLIMAYRLALDYVYINMVCRLYGYDGYYYDLLLPLYGASLLAVLAFSPFMVRLQETKAPSSRVVTFLNYIYFIPLTSYCGCGAAGPDFFLIGLVYWAMLLLFQFRLPVLSLKALPVRHARQSYLALTVLSAAFVMIISGRYTGFRFTLDIINVYDIRRESAAYDIPGLFSYVLSMMGIVLAILLLYWLTRKKRLAVAALVVVYLFLFSISAQKSLFFYLLLLLAGYYLYRPWMLRWLGGLMVPFAAAAVLEEKLIGSAYLMTLFFRRCMYLVVRLSHQYMRFFQDNPLSLFRDSILGKLPGISSVYTAGIPKIIGEFRGHMGEGANNGLLGDMFANFPAFLGVVLMPLILVVCFRLLDAAASHLPEKLTISTCAYFAMSFSNTSWSTALLTHGFLIACLMFYFFPKKEEPLS